MHRPATATTILTLTLVLLGSAAHAQSADPGPALTPGLVAAGVHASADPVAAVDAYVDAFVSKRWAELPALTCASDRDAIAGNYTAADLAPGVDLPALLAAMTISITDRSVTLKDSSVDTATVTLGGTLSIVVPDDALRTFVGQVMAGSSPSPERLEQTFDEALAQLESLTLLKAVPVERELGGWLICSDIVNVPSPTPGGSDAPIATSAP